jgi:hypothetical protein
MARKFTLPSKFPALSKSSSLCKTLQSGRDLPVYAKMTGLKWGEHFPEAQRTKQAECWCVIADPTYTKGQVRCSFMNKSATFPPRLTLRL